MHYPPLRKARIALIVASVLPLLAACAIGQMGNCGAFCGKGTVVRSEVGSPSKDPSRGSVLSLGGVLKNNYWVWSRATIERIAELPGQPKTDPLRYIPNLPADQARGSQWYTVTWGRDEIDPQTKLPRKGILIDEPSPPPGLYRLTSQVSFIGLTPGRYTPFQGKPRTTTISVEAGKTTVSSYRTEVDTSTTPITAWVDVVQLGSAEALPLMYKNPNYRVSPHMQIADPPTGASAR